MTAEQTLANKAAANKFVTRKIRHSQLLPVLRDLGNFEAAKNAVHPLQHMQDMLREAADKLFFDLYDMFLGYSGGYNKYAREVITRIPAEHDVEYFQKLLYFADVDEEAALKTIFGQKGVSVTRDAINARVFQFQGVIPLPDEWRQYAEFSTDDFEIKRRYMVGVPVWLSKETFRI